MDGTLPAAPRPPPRTDYHASFSTDNAASWTKPKPIDGAGCVLPRLHNLPSGPLILTGGRLCVEGITGLFLWINADVSAIQLILLRRAKHATACWLIAEHCASCRAREWVGFEAVTNVQRL